MSRAKASRRVIKVKEICDEWFPYGEKQLNAIDKRNTEVGNILCDGDWNAVIKHGTKANSPNSVLGETKWVFMLMMHHAAWAACSSKNGSKIVSIGSGTGSALVGALEMGLFAEAYGCEHNPNLCSLVKRLSKSAVANFKKPTIERGTFPKETPQTIEALKEAQAVYVCNTVFTAENNAAIFKSVLENAAYGAVVVTMQPIPSINRDLDARIAKTCCYKSIYDEVVTWHNEQKEFYVYYLDSLPLKIGFGSVASSSASGAFAGSLFSQIIKDHFADAVKKNLLLSAEDIEDLPPLAQSPPSSPLAALENDDDEEKEEDDEENIIVKKKKRSSSSASKKPKKPKSNNSTTQDSPAVGEIPDQTPSLTPNLENDDDDNNDRDKSDDGQRVLTLSVLEEFDDDQNGQNSSERHDVEDDDEEKLIFSMALAEQDD
jgi:precorrin-6B methylase 2